MRTALVAFLISLIVAVGLTPLIRRFAQRAGVLDHALSGRKVHGRPVPRLGGIALAIAFFAPLLGLFLVDTGVGRLFLDQPDQVKGLLVGGAVIVLLGVYDDLKGCDAKAKFAVQFAVAAFAYWMGFRIEQLANPFGPPLQLEWLAFPFTLLWIVGVINALNLIDGLDGLAGGVALVAALTILTLSVWHGNGLMALMMACLAGATLGFLRYNLNPASIFMGDTGSMFLGFVISTSAIQASYKSSTAVALLVPIVALGLPIADTLIAIVRRGARGAPLFRADRGHIHHRLMALGLSHGRTVLVLHGVSLVLGGAALVLASTSGWRSGVVLFALALGGSAALRALGFFRPGLLEELIRDRRKNRELRQGVAEIAWRLRDAAEVEHIWESVRAVAPVVGAAGVALRVDADDDEEAEISFSHGLDLDQTDVEAASNVFSYSLAGERPGIGVLELKWEGGREVDPDTELAIERLCLHVGSALTRIGRAGSSATVRYINRTTESGTMIPAYARVTNYAGSRGPRDA